METQITPSNEGIIRAAQLIRDGQLVAFPTETVYGLGANAKDAEACRRIYEAKGRPPDNPLIVHIPHRDDLSGLMRGAMNNQAERLLKAFWPGPLTVVVPCGGHISSVALGGLDTVAVRCPSHPVAQKLLQLSGCPIAAPSANRSGKPSPTTAEDVYEDMNGRIPLILDGGPASVGVESTVVDLSHEIPILLRPGAVTHQQLEHFLGPVTLADDSTPARSPGMKYRHYAPRAPVQWWDTDDVDQALTRWQSLAMPRERYGLLASEEIGRALGPALFYNLGDNDGAAAQNLFAGLRTLDRERPAAIIVVWKQSTPLGAAIANRLAKAAAPNPTGDDNE
ncbi:MAG: threonylcarbamoyl-AMP synthase [Sulfobacillus benefaciens]|uniref:Threonylcarbamoyl-AMP synthase n=1 Tax=Sulfobacillus benefaciens TaxID=453960 RepID=A0A2T2XIF7_9FIRM|nr:MAG: threonylcarbamoyl-AMP synthase [Sulfobacillus benefaciens]